MRLSSSRRPIRLGHVVIGPHLEADDLVHLLVPGGQHEHGRLGAVAAQASERLEAVDAGHAHVEDDEVGGQLVGKGEGLLAAACDGDLIALLLEGVLDAARHGVFVVDDEDRC